MLLRKDPDDILEWTESKFALWGIVLLDQYRAMAGGEAEMVAMAMWDPKSLRAVINGDIGDGAPDGAMTTEERKEVAASAVARAQEIMAMPRSGAYRG